MNMGFFDKIKQGLAKTKEAIAETWNDVFSVSELDDDFYDELEESLILPAFRRLGYRGGLIAFMSCCSFHWHGILIGLSETVSG